MAFRGHCTGISLIRLRYARLSLEKIFNYRIFWKVGIEYNLEVLWDCCRRAIICGKLPTKEIDCLIGVFEYYFDILNSSIRDGKYEYLKVDAGDDFKEGLAQGMPDNPAQGRIDKVLLQGFRYIGGKVVKRSLVEIEEEAI